MYEVVTKHFNEKGTDLFRVWSMEIHILFIKKTWMVNMWKMGVWCTLHFIDKKEEK